MESIRRSRNNTFARKCLGGKDCIPASRSPVPASRVLTRTQKKSIKRRAILKASKAQKADADASALAKELVVNATNKALAKQAAAASYKQKLECEIKASLFTPSQTVLNAKAVLLKNIGNDRTNLADTEANYPALPGSGTLKAAKAAAETDCDLQNTMPAKPTGVPGHSTASVKNSKRIAKRAAKKMASERSYLQVALVAPSAAAPSSEFVSLTKGGAATKGSGMYGLSSAALNVPTVSRIAAMR